MTHHTGGKVVRGDYWMFSSPLHFVTTLQFVSFAIPPFNSLLSHSAPLVPFTVNLTDKALSLALQEYTAMIDTRKNQSNLNVFPTEKALLEELLLMTYPV